MKGLVTIIYIVLCQFIVEGKGNISNEIKSDSEKANFKKVTPCNSELSSNVHDTIRLKRKDFMVRYGTDDTNKALIHHFYDKRNNKNYLYLPAILGLSSLFYVVSSLFIFPVFLLLFALIFYYGIFRTVKWFYLLLKFNRLKLFNTIQGLRNGEVLPLDLKRSILKYKMKRFSINGKERPSKFEKKQRRLVM